MGTMVIMRMTKEIITSTRVTPSSECRPDVLSAVRARAAEGFSDHLRDFLDFDSSVIALYARVGSGDGRK